MKNKKTSELFRVLGNDIRFNIITSLISGEKCVCEIFKEFNLAQNLVSHHLAILRDSGFVTDRREGRCIYYTLNKEVFSKIKEDLEKIIKHL